eukprot:2639929-Pyramimonas_sp.AAC.1
MLALAGNFHYPPENPELYYPLGFVICSKGLARVAERPQPSTSASSGSLGPAHCLSVAAMSAGQGRPGHAAPLVAVPERWPHARNTAHVPTKRSDAGTTTTTKRAAA